jgi:hypothetical protein
MDLVDEEHVALAELREHGGEVAGPLDRRSRRDVDRHAHLAGDDAGQARLAEAGGAGQQHVVDGLRPPPGRLQDDLEVGLQLPLAHELRQGAGPEAHVGDDLGVVGGLRFGPQQLLAHGVAYRLAAPRRCRASRSSAPASPSSGRSAMTSRTSPSV